MRIKIIAKTPKHPPVVSAARAQQLIEQMLSDAADEALGLYGKTDATWHTKVKFEKRRFKYGYSVGTRSKIYTYVDKGTAPHVIKPKGNYPLAFSIGGRPKTRPGAITSYAGATGRTGVFAREVHHPGTKARAFTVAIGKRMQASMKRRARLLSKELAKP